jgi:predicted TIM-barrel enzyme
MAIARKSSKLKGARHGRIARPVRAARGVLRLATALDQVNDTDFRGRWILCPWLSRSPLIRDVWLSILPYHDVNQQLLEALPANGPQRTNVFGAVLAVDPLRSATHLIRRMKSGGLVGAVNFPSASFVDGNAGSVFERQSLGLDREIEFLSACVAEGLRVGGVTNSLDAATKLIAIGAEFLVVHRGAPTLLDADPGKDLVGRIKALAEARNMAVVGIESLIASSGCAPA